ncbi:MAG: class I SAM-dependent methyltransferase [Bacteroidota bacterium]
MSANQLHDAIQARVERERAAHTEDDVLGRSIELKNRFSHIWNYPSLRRLHESLEAYLANLEGRHALDFGCGRGERSLTMLGHGATVDGIDISKNYIAEAEQAALAAGYDPGHFRFVVGDAHMLPYDDGVFDLVVGDGILHHLDLDVALGEVHRVLKPGGRALFKEPLLDNPLLKLFRSLTPQARTEDERPLSAVDLVRIEDSARWNVESSYCGLFSAPTAVATSLLLRPFPENVFLKAADRAERALANRRSLHAKHQYVLLNLVRRS